MNICPKQLTLGFIIATWLCPSYETIRPVSADNPHSYLAEYSEPYYPGTNFPKLITPQWVGEAGVDPCFDQSVDKCFCAVAHGIRFPRL